MHKYHCLNPIAAVGLDLFSDDYQKVEDLKDAEAVLVRSAAMHQNPQFCGFAPRGKLVGECLPQTLLCGLRRKNISVRQTGNAPKIANRPAHFL